ncbi:MAG: 30S ribosomal protein S6 [Balneolales bacterium]|nr:30S ribosomal protein S6 [Balneolales bacterium]
MKKNYYEHLLIINPVIDEEEIKATMNKHLDYLKEKGCDFDEVNEWGIQRLAYDIDGKRSGFYVNVYFTGPSDVLAPYERNLQIDDNVMRYMTIKYDNKMLRHRELQKKGAVPEVFPEIPDEDEEKDAD